MPTQAPNRDDGSIQWETRTSKNGVPYRVGRPKTEKDATTGTGKPSERGPAFDIDVNMPPVPKWTDTTDDVKRTAAISSYKLYEYGSKHNTWELWIRNTDIYSYYFTTQTGDVYSLYTWIRGPVFIDFNSPAPTIVHIRGN
jgi:hypothetical protein